MVEEEEEMEWWRWWRWWHISASLKLYGRAPQSSQSEPHTHWNGSRVARAAPGPPSSQTPSLVTEMPSVSGFEAASQIMQSSVQIWGGGGGGGGEAAAIASTRSRGCFPPYRTKNPRHDNIQAVESIGGQLMAY